MKQFVMVGADDPLAKTVSRFHDQFSEEFMRKLESLNLDDVGRAEAAGISASLFFAEGIAALMSVGSSRADIEDVVKILLDRRDPNKMI